MSGKFFSWEAGRSETYSAYTKSKLSSSDQVQKKKLTQVTTSYITSDPCHHSPNTQPSAQRS
ncbi:hypothetical protein YC2023_018101 [Brassica napus]